MADFRGTSDALLPRDGKRDGSGDTRPAYRTSELLAFATALFRCAGLDPDKAGTVAEILVEGDLLGHTTHTAWRSPRPTLRRSMPAA